MPVIGEFHSKFWKAQGNAPAPPGVAGTIFQYPLVQSVIVSGSLFGALQALWDRTAWIVATVRALWAIRHLDQQRELRDAIRRAQAGQLVIPQPVVIRETTIKHVDVPVEVPVDRPVEVQTVWSRRIGALTEDRQVVVARVLDALESEKWAEAQAAVQTCATTPKFHQPEQWVEYGRAIKANKGQAQNVFRHLKVVQAIRGLDDGPAPISNPEAHLLAELAYQAFSAVGRKNRKRVTH